MITMNVFGLFLLSLVLYCLAAPPELGIKFDKQNGQLPTLTLPYGTWRARKFTDDVSILDHEHIHSLTIT